MGKTTQLRELAKRWGLDYHIGFDYNVWSGTYLSAPQALGCTSGLALIVLYILAMCFGNVASLESEAHETFGATFALATFVALNVAAYLPSKFQTPFKATGVAVAASVITAMSTLVLFMMPVSTGHVLTVVLGALTGLGMSITLVYWGALFTRVYIPDTASCATAGTVLATLAYAALVNLVPGPWGLAVTALLPLTNAMVIIGIAKSWPTGIDIADPETLTHQTFHDRRQHWPLFTYKVALPLVCIGAVLRMLLNHVQHNLIGSGGAVGALGLVIAAVACYVTVTFGISGLRRRAQSYARLLSMVVPLIAIASLPATAAPANDTAAANMGTLAAVMVILALTWTFMESMTLEYSLASVSICGQGIACLALGFLVATPLLEMVPADSPWFDIIGNIICLLMTLGMLPAHPAADLSRSIGGQNAETPTECQACKATAGACASGTDRKHGPTKQAHARALPHHVDGVTAEVAPVQEDAPVSTADMREAWPGERREAGGEPSHSKGRFVRRCEHVAMLYQLSPRELEVLVLLAKGRSMNHIKEELVVSEGTAKTHIRHVYRKLNVHSRHELIELIESIDVG